MQQPEVDGSAGNGSDGSEGVMVTRIKVPESGDSRRGWVRSDGGGEQLRNVSITAHCYTDIDPSLVLCLEETESESERNPSSHTHHEVIAEQLKMEGRSEREVTACLLSLQQMSLTEAPAHCVTVN